MSTSRLLIFLLFITPSMTAWSLNLSPEKIPFSVLELQFISQSKQISLSQYKGKKVMLWLFSTWCHTCVASVKAMQKKQTIWNKNGLIVLALRNYENGGYPGVSMSAFMKKFGPQTLGFNNWVIGDASKKMDQKLNAKKFPDIYFLIDENGQVQYVDTAPNRTMKKILTFSNGHNE